MAVKIKLARFGTKSKPFYRIVASEKGTKRDGRFIERLGTYDPMTAPATVALNEARVQRWLSEGAQPTEVVRRLIQKSFPGVIEKREEHQRAKIQAARKKRKQRLAAAAR